MLFFLGDKNNPLVVFSVRMSVDYLFFNFDFKFWNFSPRFCVFSRVDLLNLSDNFESLVCKEDCHLHVVSSEDLFYFILIEEVFPCT